MTFRYSVAATPHPTKQYDSTKSMCLQDCLIALIMKSQCTRPHHIFHWTQNLALIEDQASRSLTVFAAGVHVIGLFLILPLEKSAMLPTSQRFQMNSQTRNKSSTQIHNPHSHTGTPWRYLRHLRWFPHQNDLGHPRLPAIVYCKPNSPTSSLHEAPSIYIVPCHTRRFHVGKQPPDCMSPSMATCPIVDCRCWPPLTCGQPWHWWATIS